MLTVGSLFAGIGGFDLGFERNGFEVRWQAEQDKKAQAVLSARFPTARLYDDVRTVGAATVERVDVICGGFPCQDVSVAGKREGLGGERTGLFWEAVRIIDELKPTWAVLENVPGLLSSHGGRDFHTVLSALADLGFRRAYRILDSRYFGVAQRRRRVFIVLRARRCGDSAQTVLFESEGSGGDSQESDDARPDLTGPIAGGAYGTGRRTEDDPNLVAYALNASPDAEGRMRLRPPSLGVGANGDPSFTLSAGAVPAVFGVHANQRGELRTSSLAGSLNGTRSGKQFEGVFATLNSGGNNGGFRTEPGEHLIEVSRPLVQSMHKRHDDDTDTLIPTLSASLGHYGHSSPRGDGNDPLVAFALRADPGGTGQGHDTTYPGGVRRLTPLECERLQGFPDGWTCLCGEGHRGSSFCTCSDSPRYRQLGNAVTVNVAEWIAQRVLEADR
jgi:DNA (cytosine-5)-methyltransferase 1